MTVLDWQMAIHAQLENGLPNTKVYLEGLPESSPVTKDPTGMLKPMLIVWFGQLTDLENRQYNMDLCGNEDGGEVKTGSFIVESIAPTGLALLQLENVVRGLLTGFSPAGHQPLYEGGSATIRDPYPTGIGDTLRFYKPLFFSGVILTDRLESRPQTLLAPSARTHCPEGHPYDEVNTVINADGKRRCRTCINARARARRLPV
jgi:hypothetical protein